MSFGRVTLLTRDPSSKLRRSVSRLAPLILGVAVGCATSTSTATDPKARPVGSPPTLVELRAQNAGYMRRIEELQNRVFILEDKLDSRGGAGDKRKGPGRPSKRLGGSPPRAAARTGNDSPPSSPASQGEETQEETIEYAGEAALPAKRGQGRPLLRLVGSGPSAVAAAAPPPPPPSPSPDPPPPPPPAESTTSSKPLPSDPLRLFHHGLDALHAGRDAVALTSFRTFLARYPRHGYADNAQYWIGECYYDLKQFHAAAREFRRVVERFPHGNMVPEAMLKLGFSHLASGDRHEGRQVLESLRRSYPKHSAARLAATRLSQPEEPAPAPARTVTLEMTRR